MTHTKFFFFLLLILPLGTYLQAQQRFQFSAGKLSGNTIDGVRYNIFERSPQKRVSIKQGQTTVYCDKAIENALTKDVTASGNILITQGNMKIKGETMQYFQRSGLVIIASKKKVKMTQKDLTLTTDKLYYNMNSGNAYYLDGGQVVQKTMNLTSEIAYLRKKEDLIAFSYKVVMIDKAKGQTLETDTMAYDMRHKIATFPKATFIKTKDGYVAARGGGLAKTKTQEAFFTGETISETPDYQLQAQDLYVNDSLDYGIAKERVKFTMKQQNLRIYSDHMRYNGNALADAKAHGHAYMEMPLSATDTLFLSADTLYSVTNADSSRTMFAYHNVQVYSRKMQGKCDSLVYNLSDSMIYFYQKPVLWAQGSQISGSAISAKLKKDDIDRMFIDEQSFIVSKDSLGNYNQIGGKKMVARFNNGFIKKVDIDGNGETIYFALEGDSLLLGMNYIKCSAMAVYFLDSNRISDITYITQAESKFIPPHELQEPDKRLKNFKPQFDRQPRSALIDRLRKRLGPIQEKKQ